MPLDDPYTRISPAADPCAWGAGGVVQWHVAQTEPNGEFRALLGCSRLPGIKAYLPTEVESRWARRNGRPVIENGHRKREDVIRPFFRGYILFACPQGSNAWAPLARRNRETNTTRVLCDTAFRPLVVPTTFVEKLQARGRAGDGAIDLRAPAFPALAIGSKVRLPDGPFEDLEFLVAATHDRRVEVMLGMLRMTVEREMVDLVAEDRA